jgi:hypothetical protein
MNLALSLGLRSIFAPTGFGGTYRMSEQVIESESESRISQL